MPDRQSLYFTAPRTIEIRTEPLPQPTGSQVLIATIVSAISAGTELLLYRGQAPTELPADETIPSLSGTLSFPLKYGYALVGQVLATGPEAEPAWRGKRVFVFHPHESHFLAEPSELVELPSDVEPEQAVFLANMETAVTLVLDGQPCLGERVVVFGQGIVGLLTAALLAQYPLSDLITLDQRPVRRQASLAVGAHSSLDPVAPGSLDGLGHHLHGSGHHRGADLIYEVSGEPAALDQAIALAGFSGRIVVGSWYGRKRVDLDLGSRFHRARLRLISSQVSTIAPELSGRWNNPRRLGLALEQIKKVAPTRFVTHRFPLAQAPQAYHLLDQQPDHTMQVLLTY
jgi:2-desacetyl-2-hydroxyethyl bacteriochlorophyllide A dehydrogenase